jgi:hypothetical protein
LEQRPELGIGQKTTNPDTPEKSTEIFHKETMGLTRPIGMEPMNAD